MSEPMTCAEAEPLLPLVADGAIDPDSDPSLFAHLAACPACQRAVASHDLIALAIASAPPRLQRRTTILQFWPYAAAAAGLVLAAGVWLAPGKPSSSPAVASTAAALPTQRATPAPAVATVAPGIARDVIAIPRSDGSTLYLVRQGDVWVPLDPTSLDGPVSPAHNGDSGVQVRF